MAGQFMATLSQQPLLVRHGPVHVVSPPLAHQQHAKAHSPAVIALTHIAKPQKAPGCRDRGGLRPNGSPLRWQQVIRRQEKHGSQRPAYLRPVDLIRDR